MIVIIFGATGDLATNKLIPALRSLYKDKSLPEKFYVLGVSRREMTDEEYRKTVLESASSSDDDFTQNFHYQQLDFDNKEGYQQITDKLKGFDEEVGACVTRFFYLATPPTHYETILDNIVASGLHESCGPESEKLTKIVIEKPFGKDLETARALDKKLAQTFSEEQIFRVDHYLGKETVQNILAFRFANGIFEPIWNKDYIDHVQITWAEEEGVRTRGAFFDGVGILRDVGQNHLMQLLAAVGMEQPSAFSKEGLRDARAAVIKNTKISPEEPVVVGQYKGYRSEKNVNPASLTDTFIAMKLYVATSRFSGIPFYLRAGKKMEKDEVKISVVFRQTCHILFKEYGCPEIGNVLTIRIQPDEGISLRIIAKKPGAKLALQTVDMKFSYKDSFETKGLEAYEKILLDIFSADQTLFNRSDELESSWSLITEILAKVGDSSPRIYDEGSWGPKEADELIEKDGKKWL